MNFLLETVPSELGRKRKHFLIEAATENKAKKMQNIHKQKTRNTQKQTEEAAEEEGNKPKQNLVTKTKQKMPWRSSNSVPKRSKTKTLQTKTQEINNKHKVCKQEHASKQTSKNIKNSNNNNNNSLTQQIRTVIISK